MGFQVQALRIESVKHHAIAHIVISTCRRIFVRKHLLTQQAVFLLLIPQIVLQQDILKQTVRTPLRAARQQYSQSMPHTNNSSIKTPSSSNKPTG